MRMLFMASVVIIGMQSHPFDGHWIADMTASRFNGAVPVKETTLDFVISGSTVAITTRSLTLDGRVLGPSTSRFTTDGEPHRHDELMPGLIVVAKWATPRLLDTMLTRADGVIDRVTYDLSDDGAILTTRTAGPFGTQEIVLRR